MNRRNFFKMLGTVAASAVCAPLAKLLPQDRPQLTINRITCMNYPVRWFSDKDLALSTEDFTKRYVLPAFHKVMAEEEKNRALAWEDLKHIAGNPWPS